MKKLLITLILFTILSSSFSQPCKTRFFEKDPISDDETVIIKPSGTGDYLREDSTKVANRVMDISFKSKKYTDSTYYFLVINYRYFKSTDFYYATDKEMTLEVFFNDGYYIRTAPTRQFFDSKVTDIQKNSITFECRASKKDIQHFAENYRFYVTFNIKEKKKNKADLNVQKLTFYNNLNSSKIQERAKCMLQ